MQNIEGNPKVTIILGLITLAGIVWFSSIWWNFIPNIVVR